MFFNSASIFLSAMTLASCFTFQLENIGRQDLNDTTISLNDPIDSDFDWIVTMKTMQLEVESGKAFAGLYEIVANCSSKNEDVSCRAFALLPDVVKDTCVSEANPLTSSRMIKSRLVFSDPFIRACHGFFLAQPQKNGDTISVPLSKRVNVLSSLGNKIDKAGKKKDVYFSFRAVLSLPCIHFWSR